MVNSTMNNIEFVSRQLMIILGITMFIFGFIGNILNIRVFTLWSRSRRTTNNANVNNRTNNASLYLLTSSISNLIIIGYLLPTRILSDGYQYRVTQNTVLVLCKLRYYSLHTFNMISLTCVCIATLDRYLISSRDVRLRNLSTTRKGTKFIICMILLTFGLHNIPIGLYFDVSHDGKCVIYSDVYLCYYRYTVQIILHGILPIIFFSFFAFLIYRQLKSMKSRDNEQRFVIVDKQLSQMLLLVSITMIVSSISYSIESIYDLMIGIHREEESNYVFLYHIVSSLLFYGNSTCSFYIYYISTPNFRHQVRKIICYKRNSAQHRKNQVNTITM
ncbi:hypothetical protein I4U23_021596 [Adineta vaga]|nr:hypothetical protein I4U23_021596 [Adineta vaga]